MNRTKSGSDAQQPRRPQRIGELGLHLVGIDPLDGKLERKRRRADGIAGGRARQTPPAAEVHEQGHPHERGRDADSGRGRTQQCRNDGHHEDRHELEHQHEDGWTLRRGIGHRTQSLARNDSDRDTVQHEMHIDIYSDVICPWCYLGDRPIRRGPATGRDRRRCRSVSGVPARSDRHRRTVRPPPRARGEVRPRIVRFDDPPTHRARPGRRYRLPVRPRVAASAPPMPIGSSPGPPPSHPASARSSNGCSTPTSPTGRTSPTTAC